MQEPKSSAASSVRIPIELRQWLSHRAVDNYRSLNGEIVARLEQSRRQEEQRQTQGAAV